MKVAILTAFNTALNPYIILFKEALELQGLTVRLKRNFNLKWLSSEGKNYDCIHLHWLDIFYKLPKQSKKNSLSAKIIANRFVHILLDLYSLMNFVLTFLIAKAAGKITVFTVHDLHDFGKKSIRHKFLVEIGRNIVFRFFDSIQVHNHYTRKLIETRYKRKKGIYVIPHGNFIGYYSNKVSKSEARYQLNLSDDAIVYLFLGLLRPYKGLEDLIRTFKKLEWPNARLLIAGRVFGVGNYESKLKALSRTDPRIKVEPDFIPDEAVQVYLKACDFFVLPYKDITTSGASALALSFGRPIIAPSISSFPEIVLPTVGILYEPSKREALINALNIARETNFSETDILDYAHKFNWDEIGSQLIQLYYK
jgi:glycosyltransferase involved in cell wall biosynthesis